MYLFGHFRGKQVDVPFGQFLFVHEHGVDERHDPKERGRED